MAPREAVNSALNKFRKYFKESENLSRLQGICETFASLKAYDAVVVRTERQRDPCTLAYASFPSIPYFV